MVKHPMTQLFSDMIFLIFFRETLPTLIDSSMQRTMLTSIIHPLPYINSINMVHELPTWNTIRGKVLFNNYAYHSETPLHKTSHALGAQVEQCHNLNSNLAPEVLMASEWWLIIKFNDDDIYFVCE